MQAEPTVDDGVQDIATAMLAALRPDPVLQLDTWSEQNIVLPKGSAFSGPYRIAHTPYARRILQALSPGDPCARVVVIAASQMLKTQVFINAALGWIDLAPANILALEPTDKLAKRLSSRLGKAIDACSAVAGKVAKPRSRDSRNTIDCKEFDGGALYITTAGSASNLAEIPARYTFVDEADRTETSVAGEGDPVELAEARSTTYEGISKSYIVSSPTIRGISKIEALFELGTREEYHVPCPHCGHLHPLVEENFHFDHDPDADAVSAAWFVCPDCGGIIEETDKATMLPDVAMGGAARWVATAKGDGETVSFHINAFYAPIGSISWVKLARQKARAIARKQKGDNTAWQVWKNTRLAQTYDNTESTTTAAAMQARAEPYPPRVIPDRALVVTAAVDTQDNRLEVQIEAWGPGMEHWLLDYIILPGDPAEPPNKPDSVWARLDEIRRTPFAHASGAKPIPISAYLIDSGGHYTQDVYNYGASRAHLGCLVGKGANRPNRPIISSAPSKVDITWQGRRTEDGAALWFVGTDVAKDYLHNRLKLRDGPGAFHHHDQLPIEWYEGFLSERVATRYAKGRAIREWICAPGARNEPLDLSVYNLAVAHHLGLHKWSATDWQRLRSKLVPANLTPDLFSMPGIDLTQQPIPSAQATQPGGHAPAPPPGAPHPLAPVALPAITDPVIAPPQRLRRVLNPGIRL